MPLHYQLPRHVLREIVHPLGLICDMLLGNDGHSITLLSNIQPEQQRRNPWTFAILQLSSITALTNLQVMSYYSPNQQSHNSTKVRTDHDLQNICLRRQPFGRRAQLSWKPIMNLTVRMMWSISSSVHRYMSVGVGLTGIVSKERQICVSGEQILRRRWKGGWLLSSYQRMKVMMNWAYWIERYLWS